MGGGPHTPGGMNPLPASDAFYFRSDAGQRLCVHHAPRPATTVVRAAVLYLHPFGEEMNKSRRMAWLQARALAAADCAVLQIDLLGCGDSSGLLSDASWQAWLDDVHAACHWLTERYPGAPLWLWGLRLGGLLATEAAAGLDRPAHLLLWQALVTGKTQLQQALRLKAAGSLDTGGSPQTLMAELRARLAAGGTVDVAGYPLPAGLARSLEAAALKLPRAGSRVHWFEVSARPEAGLAAASSAALARWRTAGVDLRWQVLRGPAFWQAADIELAPELIQPSVDAICGNAGVAA